ncbi:MAG TPA: PP2C family serine/threonine-protein phosphatase [Streptosporangiaceae bacterium]|jgi:protein phosphatase
MTIALRYAVRSDVGLLREGNEDSAYAGPHLLAIADGMGGHAAGEVASAVAISALAGLDAELPVGDLLDLLAQAVASANSTLHEMSLQDPSVEGMGTTLTAMLWSGSSVALCHIGDSRAYLLRDGDFYQITHDHTLVQTLVDDGRLSPEQAHSHPQRSLVMRALQSSTDAEPDLSMREAEVGDRYLLCSDGLSDVVTEQTLQQTLTTFTDREKAVHQLIDLAIRGGGPDNITCIVADVVDPGADADPDGQTSVIVGAASNGDGRSWPRPDSPAARARLLTKPGTAGFPAAGQTTAGSPDGLNGRAVPGDDDGLAQASLPRRRWPLVTSILAILVLVVAGGGYAAWRYTQSQYYVGADGSQVVIYRGVNQNVAGLSLSSVYQRTGISMDHVTANDKPQITSTITASSLPDARRIVTNIRHAYACQQAQAAVAKWKANKPKPVPPKRVKGKLVKQKQPSYPPEPTVPAYCGPAQGAA